jgi:hypothetical protein
MRGVSLLGARVTQLAALAVWGGGLVTLGAIVAPAVFSIVPPPSSADAMTVVFQRFDRVAIACAVVALLTEALLVFRGGRIRLADVARGVAIALATCLAIGIAVWLSPAIADLHRGGAIRGVDEGGLALHRLHRFAEALAKAELASLAVGFGLAAVRAAPRGMRPATEPDVAPP